MMEATRDIEEFFEALRSLDYGRVTRIDDSWMFFYDPVQTVHTDGLRDVRVRLDVSPQRIRFEKYVDGQKRQYQQPDESHTDFDPDSFVLTGEEEVEYRYRIDEQGATTFHFEIVVDGETYYNFFHEEEQSGIS